MFCNEIQIAQQQKLGKAGELQTTWMSSSICLAVCHPTTFFRGSHMASSSKETHNYVPECKTFLWSDYSYPKATYLAFSK